ncbi:phosphatase PAP2-related protein [Hymenobacter baengnokdamensis]|uniref:phosphatase PAP2-related protein n=1 Tax=Hymenobacter baengnokdamensis TaxID=2615203 RepID=UPI00124548CB|nr:phosphatase PAP2-related protein [Hymenobacter baengnokdamensis]
MPALPLAAPPACPATPQAPLPVADAWGPALARPAFRASWLVLLLLLFGVLVPLVPGFFFYIQQRPGTVLADPLLALLPRHNVATPVFVLMYGAVLAAVGWLTRHPLLFLRGLWGYFILLLLRLFTIWLVPLAPPLDLLPMPDPFTAQLFHTTGGLAITKDLFFSGHTATVAILALAVRGYWWRRVLALVALCIGVLVLVQRVHYTYDVLAAPLFAWFAYWLAGHLTRRATQAPLPVR